MKKSAILVLSVFLCINISTAAFAGGGAAVAGALESTQWLNKALLEGLRETGLQEVYTQSLQYTKQIQQYSAQLQQLAAAIKNIASSPFKVANDFKNATLGLYSSVKGGGEALFSYANADNWLSDMTSSSGIMLTSDAQLKNAKAGMKLADEIVTKGESEAALAEDIENRSNAADGGVKAQQAATEAILLNNQVLRDISSGQILYTKEQLNYNAWLVAREQKGREESVKSAQYALSHKR